MPKPPVPRDPNESYQVDLCGHCHHPGGQHVWGEGCRLCPDCPGWDDATRMRGWWSDRQTAGLLAAMEEMPKPPGPPKVSVTLTLDPHTARLLSVLTDDIYDDLESVLMRLAACARDGVLRPGAWERDWLVSVFGTDWTGKLEQDPKVPHHQRPRKEPGDGDA